MTNCSLPACSFLFPLACLRYPHPLQHPQAAVNSRQPNHNTPQSPSTAPAIRRHIDDAGRGTTALTQKHYHHPPPSSFHFSTFSPSVSYFHIATPPREAAPWAPPNPPSCPAPRSTTPHGSTVTSSSPSSPSHPPSSLRVIEAPPSPAPSSSTSPSRQSTTTKRARFFVPIISPPIRMSRQSTPSSRSSRKICLNNLGE